MTVEPARATKKKKKTQTTQEAPKLQIQEGNLSFLPKLKEDALVLNQSLQPPGKALFENKGKQI